MLEKTILPSEVTQALEMRAKAAKQLVTDIQSRERSAGKILMVYLAPDTYALSSSVTTTGEFGTATSTIIITPQEILEHRTETKLGSSEPTSTTIRPLQDYDLLKKALTASNNAPPKEVIPQTIQSIQSQAVIANQISRDILSGNLL